MNHPAVGPLRPILVKERLHVPIEHVINPFSIIEELTIKNMAFKPKLKDIYYGIEGKRGGMRRLTKEDYHDYSLFQMAEIDTATNHLVVPRAYDIAEKLWPRFDDQGYTYESELLAPDLWRHVTLGRDNIVLGPNESIRYDQTEAWAALHQELTFPYGAILGLGCGKGKTVLALKHAYHRHVPTLVICHTRQMVKAWSDTAAASWCLSLPKFRHGFIGDGKCDWQGKDIVFSTMHGLVCRQYPEEFWRQWGLVIFDEGDLLGATELSQVLPRFLGERILLTATIEREDGHDALYYNHIGKICYYDIKPDLEPQCVVYDSCVPEFDNQGEEVTRRIYMPSPNGVNLVAHIPLTLSNIVLKFPQRRTWAMSLVKHYLDEGRKILFLGERVAELKSLNRRATEDWPEYKSGLALGGQHTTPDQISETLVNCDVIWGIQQIANRGLNQPSIDTIFIQYCCFKKEGRLRQTIGRALRYHRGKLPPLVVLLNDPKIEVFDNKAKILTYMLRELEYKVEWHFHEEDEGPYDTDEVTTLKDLWNVTGVDIDAETWLAELTPDVELLDPENGEPWVYTELVPKTRKKCFQRLNTLEY